MTRTTPHPLTTLLRFAWAQARAFGPLTYRGGDLLMFGLIFLGIGLSIPFDDRVQNDLVYTHLPVWFRLLVWCGPAFVAILASWLPRWQNLGFGLLAVGPAERTLGYLWAMWENTDRIPGFFVYALITSLILRLASRAEPPE